MDRRIQRRGNLFSTVWITAPKRSHGRWFAVLHKFPARPPGLRHHRHQTQKDPNPFHDRTTPRPHVCLGRFTLAAQAACSVGRVRIVRHKCSRPLSAGVQPGRPDQPAAAGRPLADGVHPARTDAGRCPAAGAVRPRGTLAGHAGLRLRRRADRHPGPRRKLRSGVRIRRRLPRRAWPQGPGPDIAVHLVRYLPRLVRHRPQPHGRAGGDRRSGTAAAVQQRLPGQQPGQLHDGGGAPGLCRGPRLLPGLAQAERRGVRSWS